MDCPPIAYTLTGLPKLFSTGRCCCNGLSTGLQVPSAGTGSSELAPVHYCPLAAALPVTEKMEYQVVGFD